LRVDEIDARTAGDEVLHRLVVVEQACWPETNPGEPPRSVDEATAYYRHQPTSHTSCFWIADGGFASVHVHGPTATFFQVLVLPERRRQGIGTALLDAVLTRARELDVQMLHGHHATPAGRAFAARAGFSDGQRVVNSVLDLRATELPPASPPAGWQLVTWLRRVPDEHLPAFVRARASMDDAPMPDGMDFPSTTADTVRASEESLARRDREMRVTVAVRADGEIGAFTELRVSRGSRAGFTDDTGTVAEHRGQGLARAVKLSSLGLLRRDHPEIEVVTTSNAEENAAMRGLNESIGFRPTSVETTATLVL
jgi:GNAT superfamily N-acetyltransferase